ncbi:hypothetical protein CRG98_041234 [Punica granatum]|uniref:Uncharacterized protein n=1 Tax=Punica granatum TaxID=22663 RepID=A0A2I0I323_PUNGR|nr:hypothetical protein CRG98_041234 [Punica granatum]
MTIMEAMMTSTTSTMVLADDPIQCYCSPVTEKGSIKHLYPYFKCLTPAQAKIVKMFWFNFDRLGLVGGYHLTNWVADYSRGCRQPEVEGDGCRQGPADYSKNITNFGIATAGFLFLPFCQLILATGASSVTTIASYRVLGDSYLGHGCWW